MTPIEILYCVGLVLAFIGYVWCLSRLFWVTLALTAGLGYYMSRTMPPDAATLAYWGAAGGVFLVALMVLYLLPDKPAEPKNQLRSAKGKGREIVVDGTNVMYWNGDADLDTLRGVVAYLAGKGLAPIVFLDASSRHHLGDKSLNEKGFANALGLPRDRVMVCPAQTEADAFILKFAKEQDLPVVSNDRFGDRAQQAKGLKLIKGVYTRGKPILEGL